LASFCFRTWLSYLLLVLKPNVSLSQAQINGDDIKSACVTKFDVFGYVLPVVDPRNSVLEGPQAEWAQGWSPHPHPLKLKPFFNQRQNLSLEFFTVFYKFSAISIGWHCWWLQTLSKK
jgi:hypothetical protein